jgi:3,4-dihydroxy 2-butanone 4-phosphate synthase/GTP cyclohydrolase II
MMGRQQEKKKAEEMLEALQEKLATAKSMHRSVTRPFIAVTYAQSLDGSIATRDRQQIRISNDASMRLTHQLRICFDGILVGIGTILSDNPRLNARWVKGKNPQPLVLDTHLRTPIHSNLVQRTDQSSWIVAGRACAPDKRGDLERAGARIFPCDVDTDGRIDLQALMALLARRKIGSLMIEGGARIITSFINAQLVDQIIITISPQLIGGLPVIDERGLQAMTHLSLDRVEYEFAGKDIIVWAQPAWNRT